MQTSPLVSVLMTCFNREKYIAAAIESVLASSYTNFELIIVDDTSKDKTVEIAKSYAAKDDRISVYINEKNLGDYVNRNKAASYAKGKYLKYVDSDDIIYPKGLEILVFCMEKFPNAGWGLCSLSQFLDKPYPFEIDVKEIYRFNFFTKSIFHKAPLSSIIKKDAFDCVGGFSGKQHLGDFELWHLLALKFNVVLMSDGIVWCRNHNEQQKNDNQKKPLVGLKYNISQYHFLKANGRKTHLTSSEISAICNRHKKLILKQIIKFSLRLEFKNFIAAIKMFNNEVDYNFNVKSIDR
ncbi:MAG: glycosyltransferase family 2 protein [Chitinophagaceae bacterium]